jgi:hypothetical protein
MKNIFANSFAIVVSFILLIPFYLPDSVIMIDKNHVYATYYGWFITWTLIVLCLIFLLAYNCLYNIGLLIFDNIKNS